MAKKKIKDINISVDTEKVDVNLKKEGDKKEFTLDGQKLDIHVEKTETGTVVTVDAQNSFLKKVGNWISKIFVKKFNK